MEYDTPLSGYDNKKAPRFQNPEGNRLLLKTSPSRIFSQVLDILPQLLILHILFDQKDTGFAEPDLTALFSIAHQFTLFYPAADGGLADKQEVSRFFITYPLRGVFRGLRLPEETRSFIFGYLRSGNQPQQFCQFTPGSYCLASQEIRFQAIFQIAAPGPAEQVDFHAFGGQMIPAVQHLPSQFRFVVIIQLAGNRFYRLAKVLLQAEPICICADLIPIRVEREKNRSKHVRGKVC